MVFPSRHGPVQALAGLDLDIPKGSLFVLLGPNGAGKTTLMRCITGLVRPTAGRLSVFDVSQESFVASMNPSQPSLTSVAESSTSVAASSTSSLTKEAISAHPRDSKRSKRGHLARLGVLIENPGVYSRLNVREYLEFFGSFYGLTNLKIRISSLCKAMGLAEEEKPVAKLSQGNRQKLQLVRSLLHKPELLLWDEPTDHLDPVSQRQVLQYLSSYLADTGATALVATHRLEQMESVASHFGFISHGLVVRAGNRSEILAESDGLEYARLGFTRMIADEELSGIGSEFSFQIQRSLVTSSPSKTQPIEIVISGKHLSAKIPAVIKAMVVKDLPLSLVEPVRQNLGDIYERWVGK